MIRFWEGTTHCVVLGRSRSEPLEVDDAACQRLRIPILRRASGGGTVLLGPGCLNFSLALHLGSWDALRDIRHTADWIASRHREALDTLVPGRIRVEGEGDLTLNGRKFSGMAQLRRRNGVLVQGAILYAFDLDLMEAVLRLPARQPEYRAGRIHGEFLVNLDRSVASIKERIIAAWGCGSDRHRVSLPPRAVQAGRIGPS